MTWNWQQPDWPVFSWSSARLARAEEAFLLRGGVFLGSIGHLRSGDAGQLTADTLSVEAVTTSEIEGEILDRASVQSSIQRQLGLLADNRRVGAAEQGIAEMMVNLHRSYAEPLTEDSLFHWHRLLASGRSDLGEIGRYRSHPEPMQIVSGPGHAPKIHYEAPPSARVPGEMSQFLDWFNRTGPAGPERLPALTRSGIAHFYFVCIHPFEDGNGRIGRAIAQKALSQGLGRFALLSLAATILAGRRGYYEALAASNHALELTDWLSWFAAVVLEAQRRTLALVEFLLDKTRLLDRVRGQLNERQEKALLRVLRAGPTGFEGGLSAGKYTAITGASTATATRDLADMVARGALVRTGERRHARYHPALPLRPVPAVSIDRDGRVIETL